jgi:hypothetical protein
MVNTFENQSKILGQTIQSVLISGGMALLPALQAAVQGVKGFVAETAPQFDAWQTRIGKAFQRGGFDAWLKEVGEVAGELGRQIEKWAPQFVSWAGQAKERLTTVLGEVWGGTIVPWIERKADELKTFFTEVWLPALIDWWNSGETQAALTAKMDAFGVFVKDWAGEGGAGNLAVKEAGTSLGGSLVNSLQQGAVDAFAQLPQWLQDVLRGKFNVFPQVTPGTGGGSSEAAPGVAPGSMAPGQTLSPIISSSALGPSAVSGAAGAAAGRTFSPFDEVFRKYAGALANDDQFIAIVAAGVKAESGFDPNRVGDQGHSLGLFQMHDQGAGAGMGASRANPDAASARMVPAYVTAYREGLGLGLSGAALASYTARYAEHPFDYANPNSQAGQNYTAAYNAVIGGTAPSSASSRATMPGQTLSVPLGMAGNYVGGGLRDIAGAGEAAAPSTSDVIGGGTLDPYALTKEKLDAALGGASAQAAAGAKGRALIKAFDDAIENEKPQALETLTTTMYELRDALLNDPQLSPETAQARFAEVTQVISDALLDGSDEAQDAARKYIASIETGLAIDKVVEETSKKSNIVIENAQVAITAAFVARDKQIAALSTKKEEAIVDRDLQQAEADRIAKAVEGAQQYVKAQEDSLAALHDLQKQDRDFSDQVAKADLMYMEKIAEFQTKKQQTATASTSFAVGMGGVATTSHTDPQAAINQQIKDAVQAHNVDMFNIAQEQSIKAANHTQDVAWKLEETALASTLKATILEPTAETARAASNAWKDAYDKTVVIPREAAAYMVTTQTSIDKINTDLGAALTGIRNEGDTAIARIHALSAIELPLVQTAAGTVMDPAIADANTWVGILREGAAILGSAASGGTAPPPPPPTLLPDQGITAMASGGIVRRPTLALVGESGPEAVVPLNQLGGEIHVHVEIGGKEVQRYVIDTVQQANRRGEVLTR